MGTIKNSETDAPKAAVGEVSNTGMTTTKALQKVRYEAELARKKLEKLTKTWGEMTAEHEKVFIKMREERVEIVAV